MRQLERLCTGAEHSAQLRNAAEAYVNNGGHFEAELAAPPDTEETRPDVARHKVLAPGFRLSNQLMPFEPQFRPHGQCFSVP